MAVSPDDIIDRRSLRKKITFWRTGAFLLVAALIVAVFAASGLFDGLGSTSSDHIARVKISGTITNDEPMQKLMGKLKKNDRVKAVILNISSPGGTTVGGEALFHAVRDLAEAKSVATSVGTLATSAGYMVASASDHIVARRSSIIGSIGVLFQYGNVTTLLDKVGVGVDAVKSSPLKAEPSPFNETTDEERAVLQRLVEDTYQWFVGLIVERRDLDKAKVIELADGSIFSGAQSLDNGLIDAIGGEQVAKDWLTEKREIPEKLEIIEWKPKRPGDSLLSGGSAFSRFAKLIGYPVDNSTAKKLSKLVPDRLFLDGLLSIWVSSGGEVAEGNLQ